MFHLSDNLLSTVHSLGKFPGTEGTYTLPFEVEHGVFQEDTLLSFDTFACFQSPHQHLQLAVLHVPHVTFI